MTDGTCGVTHGEYNANLPTVWAFRSDFASVFFFAIFLSNAPHRRATDWFIDTSYRSNPIRRYLHGSGMERL